jgi:hypothetical protein
LSFTFWFFCVKFCCYEVIAKQKRLNGPDTTTILPAAQVTDRPAAGWRKRYNLASYQATCRSHQRRQSRNLGRHLDKRGMHFLLLLLLLL